MTGYDGIKIIHIISASLIVIGMGVTVNRWQSIRFAELGSGEHTAFTRSLQRITWTLMVPCLLFQLFSGFTMLSLKPDYLKASWSKFAILAYFILLGAWFTWTYLNVSPNRPQVGTKSGLIHYTLITLVIIALSSIIFFMANKTL